MLMREEFPGNNIFTLLSSSFPPTYAANPDIPSWPADSRITRGPTGQTA